MGEATIFVSAGGPGDVYGGGDDVREDHEVEFGGSSAGRSPRGQGFDGSAGSIVRGRGGGTGSVILGWRIGAVGVEGRPEALPSLVLRGAWVLLCGGVCLAAEAWVGHR